MATRRELSKEVARRYQKAGRGEKMRVLREFCQSTGYNRHYAAFLLRNHGRQVFLRSPTGERVVVLIGEHRMKKRRRERPRIYDQAVHDKLTYFWEVMDYSCGKRLKRVLPLLVEKARQFNELRLRRDVAEKLHRISPATIDRMLKAERKKVELRCRSKTKPGTLLKKQIAFRSGTEWDEDKVGFVELDLVGHDGGNANGDYCFTLNMTDIKSGWTEDQAIRNKAQIWVFEALQEIRSRLPFDLLGIDSDNGSEFINHHLFAYCQQEGLTFTRSRPYQKNDNCHVEQKNFTAVRNFVGYCRYDHEEEQVLLNELYGQLRLYLNFFHPQMKLVSKERIGTKVRKKYDEPQTPHQRLLNCDELSDEKKRKLQAIFAQLNPFALKRSINAFQEKLQKLVHEKKIRSTVYVHNKLKPVLA
jgi:hypothetical protein